jgi:hypothetical protein
MRGFTTSDAGYFTLKAVPELKRAKEKFECDGRNKDIDE